jgi:serine phosphatase RsbU (regulator of sigma subunit)
MYETEKKNKTIELLNKEKEKQNIVIETKEQKNKIIILSSILILLTIALFSTWLYKKYKETEKQKAIIELQKNEVENKNQLIEEQQKEIKDSINYAKRIQNSFMASENEFKHLLKEYFILFKPKDIVSGDFYWSGQLKNKLYLCVADSTGHGIPGAFMSLLNISLMNEALFSKEIENTNEILDFVRKILILGLKPDRTGQGGNDGMDCTLIRIDLATKQLQYTGANNPLWIVRNGQMTELKPNKMPVGRSPKENTPFLSETISLQPEDIIYMFTDGYADQFGGPKGKKYKYKQLNELFISISDKPAKDQLEILNESITNWKGTLEQVDDICIIGIKI